MKELVTPSIAKDETEHGMDLVDAPSTRLAPTAHERNLSVDPDSFRDNFDKRDYDFSHRLAESPLFDRDALIELTKTMSADPADVYHDAGEVRVGQRWNEVPKTKLTVNELLANIESSSGWILLKRAERVPEYGAILEACMSEIEELSGIDLTPLIAKRRALIFISSPHRVSSYHIDRECNWLLQIRGTKTVSIFDRADREILPETELERFWAVDNNAPVYRPEFQNRGRNYELVPGRGIHIPVNNPHWVKNGPEVSVSLSINFHYQDSHLGDIYRANYWLRRMGMNPQPPRSSALSDALKRSSFGFARATKRTVVDGLVSKVRSKNLG